MNGMGRKIIQISAAQSDSVGEGGGTAYSLYALCDDGTVWDYSFSTQIWTRLEPVPQDEGKP